MRADFIIANAAQLLSCAGPVPRRGSLQADARPLSDAAIASHAGEIVFVGLARECRYLPAFAAASFCSTAFQLTVFHQASR